MSVETSSEALLHETFIIETGRLPSTPLGVIGLGKAALCEIMAGGISVDSFLAMPLAGKRLNDMIQKVNTVHTYLELCSDEELARSLPFAHERVRSVFAGAFLRGKDAPDDIGLLDQEVIERSAAVLQAGGMMQFADRVLSIGMKVLECPEIKQDILLYRRGILKVSRQYQAGELTRQKLMEGMDAERQILSEQVEPELARALEPLQASAPEGISVEVVARRLTRWKPSLQLLDKYFGDRSA